MKKCAAIFLIVIFIFLTACSPIPAKLKRTADKATSNFTSGLSNVVEFSQTKDPTITKFRQISETDWCLVYQVTNDIFFASRWQKNDDVWEEVDIQPYVNSCDWVK